MKDGVEITAYLVNESRARLPDLSRDCLAADWIPATSRPAVEQLWQEFASCVYPYDDLVVALRARCVVDALCRALRRMPDTVLVMLGAGFSSYPWLLPFKHSIEIDLPEIVAAKQRRAAELRSAGRIDERNVTHLAADLADERQLIDLIDHLPALAAGRPVAVVAEGLVFYLPVTAATTIAHLGAAIGHGAPTIISYWPTGKAEHPVLAAQRQWFRRHSVPEDAAYHSADDLVGEPGRQLSVLGPEQLQREYLGEVRVPENELIPEYVAVALP
jgi:O-methyltransferase involved in polyketide biosynthesis